MNDFKSVTGERDDIRCALHCLFDQYLPDDYGNNENTAIEYFTRAIKEHANDLKDERRVEGECFWGSA